MSTSSSTSRVSLVCPSSTPICLPSRGSSSEIQERQFDLAIDIHGNGFVSRAIVSLFGARGMAAYCRPGDWCPDSGLFLPADDAVPEVRRWLDLCRLIGWSVPDEALEFPIDDAAADGSTLVPRGDKPVVVVHPGASVASRRWPARNFAAVADALANAGASIVLTGTASERDVTWEVGRTMRADAIDLSGRTSLDELAAIIRGAALVVSNDTGTSHLADALRTPSVVLFSGSEVDRWAPLDDGSIDASFPMAESRAPLRRRSTCSPDVAARGTGPMRPDVLAGSDRILLVRPDNVGDVVLLAAAIRAIRESHRDAVISLLASPAGATAVPLLPWVDEVLVEQVVWQDASASPMFDPKREFEFIERLRRGRWDAMVVFTSFSQTAFGAAYAAYLAGIPIRAGHARDFGGALLSHAVPPPDWEIHQADRALDLVEGLGIDVADRSAAIVVPPDARHAAWRLLGAIGVRPDGGYILVVPGASCGARRYPPERYAAAAGILSSADRPAGRGRRNPRRGRPDRRSHSPGSRESPRSWDSTSIPEVAALVAALDLVLCGNSSALHLADALRRPVVTIYSGTELELQWRPRQAASVAPAA